MRGRKPKPTHLKMVEGNPGKRPMNDKEAKAPPVKPEPPNHLCEEAREEWDRTCEMLYRMGLLSGADRAVLAAYCQSYARWARAEAAIAKMAERDELTRGLMIKTTNGNAVQNPLVGTANKAAADMVRYAAEIGMTPSARSRIAAEAPEAPQGRARYFS